MPHTPGIYTDEQEASWKRIVQAVHAKGGFIFMQIWHVGRVSHPSYQPNNERPISSSSTGIEGKKIPTENGWLPMFTPKELPLDGIPDLIEEYVKAARRAMNTGADGIEIHSANGYLLQQFLEDGCNKRTDAYGGSIPNRCRLVLEVVEACTKAIGPGKVAIRLAPFVQYHQIYDSNPEELYSYLLKELNRFPMAYVHLTETRDGGLEEKPILTVYNEEGLSKVYPANTPFLSNTSRFRRIIKLPLIIAVGYTKESAEYVIENDLADLVAFGRDFISNPDLPYRLQHGISLTPYDRSTFYTHDEKGYIDYKPFK
jgi:N-ethylmaleimide reductase